MNPKHKAKDEQHAEEKKAGQQQEVWSVHLPRVTKSGSSEIHLCSRVWDLRFSPIWAEFSFTLKQDFFWAFRMFGVLEVLDSRET